MKTLSGLLTAILLACTLNAMAIVRTNQRTYSGWGKDQLSLREDLVFSNDLNYYSLTLACWKSKNQTPPCQQFWLLEPCPNANFSRPNMDFFRLEVNGIREQKLFVEKEHIKPWKQGDKAGFEFTLRFDGAPIRVRWFMRPDSPVLWCTLAPGDNQVTPFKSIKLMLGVIPSRLMYDKKGTIWSGPYHRQGVTAVRTINQSNQNLPLNDQDQFLILQDAKLDGSDQDKGQGPCIIIPDKTDNGVMTAAIRNNWILTITANIPNDFKHYTFGLWTQRNKITNQKVWQRIKDNPRQFKP